jgi:hypothetical protein
MHVESTRTLKPTSAGSHTRQTLIQKHFEGAADIARSRHCHKNVLLASICNRLKKIFRLRKGKPRCVSENLHSRRQEVQDVLKETLGATEYENGDVEVHKEMC